MSPRLPVERVGSHRAERHQSASRRNTLSSRYQATTANLTSPLGFASATLTHPPIIPDSTLACDHTSPPAFADSTRPVLSIPFYDITPGSHDHVHLKALTESLRRETRGRREYSERPDHIEVCGMPLATGLFDAKKAAECKSHALAEIASRKAGGAGPDLQITRLLGPSMGQDKRLIFVIDKPREHWDEDEEGVLKILWDVEQLRAAADRYIFPNSLLTSWEMPWNRPEKRSTIRSDILVNSHESKVRACRLHY
ncbi:hypothetical protein LX32DRAFT_12685 [Colletotrichum zoysiae]|uniref:Uncharacterized protein n=1 Tax=Colletotrichum zoysiae TaxID=1216348 RepID=A0AAD9HDG1_9PEZI|nr:hypothetical protein LX32DRAFT_12685 [Colletotrichum zoysiae]